MLTINFKTLSQITGSYLSTIDLHCRPILNNKFKYGYVFVTLIQMKKEMSLSVSGHVSVDLIPPSPVTLSRNIHVYQCFKFLSQQLVRTCKTSPFNVGKRNNAFMCPSKAFCQYCTGMRRGNMCENLSVTTIMTRLVVSTLINHCEILVTATIFVCLCYC